MKKVITKGNGINYILEIKEKTYPIKESQVRKLKSYMKNELRNLEKKETLSMPKFMRDNLRKDIEELEKILMY